MNTDEIAQLRQTFEKFWAEIRGSHIYAGQPHNTQSAAAVTLAREALRLATDAEDADLLRQAEWMLAHSLTANEQNLEAIPYYENVVASHDTRSHTVGAPIPHLGYISALTHVGRYDRALDIARTAERWLKEAHDDVRYARLCTNIGNIYDRRDQYQQSYDYYALAAQTFEAIGDKESVAKVYQNVGYTLGRIDRFDEADTMYERAEQISRELGLPELEAQAKYNRAYLYFLRGRYSEALQSFARIRGYFKESGSLRHFALCDLDEAEIYLQLNISADAATLAQSATQQFKRIGMLYEEAKALAFYGVALRQMNRFGEALEAFKDSQKGFASEGNQYWVAVLDLYRADVHLELQRYWEAHALAAQARQQFETLEIPTRKMLSLVMLGRIALTLDNITDAEKYLAEIASITEQAQVPLLQFPYYMLRGQIAERRKDWQSAVTAYQLAVQDLEMHHARLQQDDMRVTFLQGRNEVYESLVALSLDNNPDPVAVAYSWCERSKSRGLVELLSHHLPSLHSYPQSGFSKPGGLKGEDSLLRRVHRLREEINVHYMRSKPETRSDLSTPDFEAVVLKEQELARTLREVALNEPEYVSLQQVTSVTLEQVQAFIPEGTTILEYFSTQEEILAFVITREDAKVFRRLAPPSRIENLHERLAFQLEKFLLGQDYVEAHSHQILEATNHYLNGLYSVLIEPLAAELRTVQLTIIPHGILHFLPFHAFFDNRQYMVDRFEIAYAPSASVLHYCMEKVDVLASSPLILGVADELAPMVEQEVELLGRMFPDARILSGAAATRDAFTEASQSASFIHIATHASFRQDNPMFSSFKLADGYVTALDLFSMNCQTNLVALSGCKSGLSEVSGSDDLLGLMRGFLYAGARSLMLSLWSVSDESTVALMTAFYEKWRGGADKAKALQAAMKQVRSTYPNPFHWAPFILVGKV